jgi:hypothetical protein
MSSVATRVSVAGSTIAPTASASWPPAMNESLVSPGLERFRRIRTFSVRGCWKYWNSSGT